MTSLLFPDNTVLISFAVMGRVDLFDRLASGRGQWTLTIAGECARSAQEPGLSELARMNEILGAPLLPTLAERVDMGVFRARLASPGDSDRQHLGEAEALAILSRRDLAAVFVTDDSGARLLAASLDVPTYSTVDLVRLAVKAHLVGVDEGWELLRVLRAHGRPVGLAPVDSAGFAAWCA